MQLQILNMEKDKKIGCLANYKYFNMDEAILDALNVSGDNIVEDSWLITFE